MMLTSNTLSMLLGYGTTRRPGKRPIALFATSAMSLSAAVNRGMNVYTYACRIRPPAAYFIFPCLPGRRKARPAVLRSAETSGDVMALFDQLNEMAQLILLSLEIINIRHLGGLIEKEGTSGQRNMTGYFEVHKRRAGE